MNQNEAPLQIATIVPCTESEGPGKRFAIWVQGCPLRCPGCCNPEMLPFAGGESMSVSSILEHIVDQGDRIEGITLLGGEPFSQPIALTSLSREVHKLGLNVLVFSGWTLEELQNTQEFSVLEFLQEIDWLVDGRYSREEPESERRFIGSKNQRIHVLSDRVNREDPRWSGRNTLEIRLVDGEVIMNGFPWPTNTQSGPLGGPL